MGCRRTISALAMLLQIAFLRALRLTEPTGGDESSSKLACKLHGAVPLTGCTVYIYASVEMDAEAVCYRSFRIQPVLVRLIAALTAQEIAARSGSSSVSPSSLSVDGK